MRVAPSESLGMGGLGMGVVADLLRQLTESLDRPNKAIVLLSAVSIGLGPWVMVQADSPQLRAAGIAFLALGFLGFFAAFIAVVREMFRQERKATSLEGRLVIGIHCGRRTVESGALSFQPGFSLTQGAAKYRLVAVRGARRLPPKPTADQYFDEVAAAVCDVANEVKAKASKKEQIDKIVIALPGLLDVREKSVQSLTSPLPMESLVAREIANRVVQRLKSTQVHFHVSDDSPRELERVIFIDNDARALTRYVLAKSSSDRRNFACVLATDEGVGSGLVLERQMFYGSYMGAGEIGHQTLDLSHGDRLALHSSEVRAQSADDEPELITVPPCTCGRRGVHFEMLCNDAGVLRLAKAIDGQVFTQLTALYGELGRSGLDGVSLIKLMQRDGSLREQLSGSARELFDSVKVQKYFQRLTDEYARLLVIGVANLVNVLDVQAVVLTGPIISAFKKVDTFSRQIEQYRVLHVLRRDRVTIDPGDDELVDHMWEGAALAVHDPQYARFLQ